MKKHLVFVLISTSLACQIKTPPQSLELFSTVSFPTWTDQFIRQDGWFGGDGIFIIPTLKNGKIDHSKQLMIFSDTMIGKIKDGKLQPGYHMVHNSVAQLYHEGRQSDVIKFSLPQDSAGLEKSIFRMQLPSVETKEYYWLGDGFANAANSNTYIFAYRVVDRLEWVDALFKFEVLGGALIMLPSGSQYPFTDHRQLSLPFFSGANEGHISFGAGIFENTQAHGARTPDEHIYIYGIRDPGKQLVVGRVPQAQIESWDSWQFYDGHSWQDDFMRCAAITDSVSNELSVTQLPSGQFALIFQINGVSDKVGMRLGKSPIGPFASVEEIWNCAESLAEPEFFAYNAKAHPSISDPGELVVSYNVNSFAFWDQIENHPHLYRPRFFKMIFHDQ